MEDRIVIDVKQVECNYLKSIIQDDIKRLKQKVEAREKLLSTILFAEERKNF